MDKIKIDTSKIPDYVRDTLAAVTLECVLEHMQQQKKEREKKTDK